ncbi:MAG: two-component system aerobic respiration control protein ArcA, partial [Psychromonas sp.]
MYISTNNQKISDIKNIFTPNKAKGYKDSKIERYLMSTANILIVEDELVTRNMLKSVFEAEGYNVLEANDGNEMHQAIKENNINLIIMDINLPGKNGLLLARELREHENIALIFLTGRDNEVDKILGLEIGADD